MRIVCLSAEAADICARLGAWEEVVAVSAFAEQPPNSGHGRSTALRRPVIGGFSSVDADRVLSFRPDLVITFSDVQADIASQLIRRGCSVLATNQRSLSEIYQTIRLIGGAIGRAEESDALAEEFQGDLEKLRQPTDGDARVYFEEWPDPLVSGIRWVGEIIELAGGIDVFSDRRGCAAEQRTVTPAEVVAANPEIMLASWCGKPVELPRIRARPRFDEISAVRNNHVHVLNSDIILQPGPRLLGGAKEIAHIIAHWREC